jgi:capsule polysaccharide export protein KpsE/RkpR
MNIYKPSPLPESEHTLDLAFLRSIGEISGSLRRHIWMTLFLIALTYSITAYFVMKSERIFEVSTTMLPKIGGDGDGAGGLMNLARTFGIGGAQKGGDQSALYEAILKSRYMMERLLAKSYAFQGNQGQSLFQVFGIDTSKGVSRARAELLLKFAKSLTIEIVPTSGITQVRFSSTDPVFAADFLNLLIKELSTFMDGQYAHATSEKLKYAQAGLDAASSDLARSSAALTAFRERNRNISPFESPQLASRMLDLERDRRIDEEKFLLFKKEVELAKIQLLDNSDRIRLIDPADPSVIGKTGRAKTAIIGFLLGPILALLVIQSLDWMTRAMVRKPVA